MLGSEKGDTLENAHWVLFEHFAVLLILLRLMQLGHFKTFFSICPSFGKVQVL